MAANGVGLILLSAAVGAVAQHYFSYVAGLPRYLWQRIRNKPTTEGVWYSYHYTRQNSVPLLKAVTWTITRNFRGQLVTVCQFDGSEDLRGTGILFRERGFLVLRTSATTYEEAEWAIRILDPWPTNDRIVPGLWLSVDFDGELTAGPIVFSRETLVSSKAEQYVKRCTSVNQQYRLLGLQKDRRPIER
jgi:hypothetical protein